MSSVARRDSTTAAAVSLPHLSLTWWRVSSGITCRLPVEQLVVPIPIRFASRTTTRFPACDSLRAVEIPVMPPPMITASVSSRPERDGKLLVVKIPAKTISVSLRVSRDGK